MGIIKKVIDHIKTFSCMILLWLVHVQSQNILSLFPHTSWGSTEGVLPSIGTPKNIEYDI